MNRPIAEDAFAGKGAAAAEAGADAPLDPAVERVRRKLLRFAIVNIGILFLALALVVAALAWRSVSAAKAPAAFVEAELALPQGAQVSSHAVSPTEISLFATLPNGAGAVFVFARADGRLVGRYAVTPR